MSAIKTDAGTVGRNRRITVPAGARWATALVDVTRGHAEEDDWRKEAERVARDAALAAWVIAHGEHVAWDMVVITFAHVTSQVLCEFRVDPPLP